MRAIQQLIEDAKSGFHFCTDCRSVPQWEGRGDWHWVQCDCGQRTHEHLDPPDAKAEWNRCNQDEQP